MLGNYLEGIKATVFRQTQFAEFELRMHEMGEKGQPITGDALAKLYLDITKKYYGHDQKILIVDDYIANEWSFIPHFYRDFYVFHTPRRSPPPKRCRRRCSRAIRTRSSGT